MENRSIEDENIQIGRMLQNARESHGVTQAEMTEATGLTKNHISAVERGVSKASIHMLLGYCKKIGITPNDVLGYEDIHIIPELKTMLSVMDDAQQKKVADLIRLIGK